MLLPGFSGCGFPVNFFHSSSLRSIHSRRVGRRICLLFSATKYSKQRWVVLTAKGKVASKKQSLTMTLAFVAMLVRAWGSRLVAAPNHPDDLSVLLIPLQGWRDNSHPRSRYHTGSIGDCNDPNCAVPHCALFGII